MKKNHFFVIALFMPHIDFRCQHRVSPKCYACQTFGRVLPHCAVRYTFRRNEHVYGIYSAKGTEVLPCGIAPQQAEMVAVNDSFTPVQQDARLTIPLVHSAQRTESPPYYNTEW